MCRTFFNQIWTFEKMLRQVLWSLQTSPNESRIKSQQVSARLRRKNEYFPYFMKCKPVELSTESILFLNKILLHGEYAKNRTWFGNYVNKDIFWWIRTKCNILYVTVGLIERRIRLSDSFKSFFILLQNCSFFTFADDSLLLE